MVCQIICDIALIEMMIRLNKTDSYFYRYLLKFEVIKNVNIFVNNSYIILVIVRIIK